MSDVGSSEEARSGREGSEMTLKQRLTRLATPKVYETAIYSSQIKTHKAQLIILRPFESQKATSMNQAAKIDSAIPSIIIY